MIIQLAGRGSVASVNLGEKTWASPPEVNEILHSMADVLANSDLSVTDQQDLSLDELIHGIQDATKQQGRN